MIAFPWTLLTVCLTSVFQIYAIVLAIFAAPVWVFFIVWEEYDYAISDIR
jgi:hypothetical protein